MAAGADMGFQAEKIFFSYNDKPVLEDFSLTVEPGGFYGILGPNGSGKTTFLDLLVNHLAPRSGTIVFQGRDIRTYSRKELSRQIALVAQNYQVNFPYTVEEIVMMGRHPYIPRFSSPGPKDLNIVEEVMERTEVARFRDRLVTSLSGGERQRVVFARALAQKTPFLILDEATSNLDINHTISMLNLVAEEVESEGKTIIAVMQDINLAAAYCNHLVFFNNGRVETHGPVEDVLTSSTIKSVFHVDAKVCFEEYSQGYQVVYKR